MKRIESFEVNHDVLEPGVYVSRKDKVGDETVTTFDLRLKKPNVEPVLGNAEIHTLEHIMATFLRSDKNNESDKVIYFGPMGCRTGFYLILAGDYESKFVVELLRQAFQFVVDFEGDIPGNTSVECGNYLEHNLTFAKFEAEKYCRVLDNVTEKNLIYGA